MSAYAIITADRTKVMFLNNNSCNWNVYTETITNIRLVLWIFRINRLVRSRSVWINKGESKTDMIIAIMKILAGLSDYLYLKGFAEMNNAKFPEYARPQKKVWNLVSVDFFEHDWGVNLVVDWVINQNYPKWKTDIMSSPKLWKISTVEGMKEKNSFV